MSNEEMVLIHDLGMALYRHDPKGFKTATAPVRMAKTLREMPEMAMAMRDELIAEAAAAEAKAVSARKVVALLDASMALEVLVPAQAELPLEAAPAIAEQPVV